MVRFVSIGVVVCGSVLHVWCMLRYKKAASPQQQIIDAAFARSMYAALFVNNIQIFIVQCRDGDAPTHAATAMFNIGVIFQVWS